MCIHEQKKKQIQQVKHVIFKYMVIPITRKGIIILINNKWYQNIIMKKKKEQGREW